MKGFRVTILYILSFLFGSSLFAEDLLWISLENKTNGSIKASLNQGKSWVSLGKVLKPGKGAGKGFPACKWGKEGTVVGISSYAIYIKVSTDKTFSILSKEMESLPKGLGEGSPGEAGILTNIKAGSLIFEDLAPFIGSKVYLREGNTLKELPHPYTLQGEEEIFIIVEEKEFPKRIVIENREGGNAYVIREGERRVTFAKVLKPLAGIERLYGTQFTGVGRITSVNPSAITISTVVGGANKSDDILLGGFQIIPWETTFKDSLPTSPSLLILAPFQGKSTGEYPLFEGTVGLENFGGKGYRVEASWDGMKWEELPILRGKIDDLASYLSRISKGKYKGIMKLISIVFPQMDLKRGTREALKRKISEEAKIVRGELDVEVRLQGEGARIVDLKIDGRLRAVKNFYPFVFSVDTRELTDGEHIVEVSAKDENGDVLASHSQKIYVDNEGLFQ